MAHSLILLFVVGVAAAQTATIKHELNSLDTKDDRRRIEFQSTLPTVMESTTSKSYHDGAKLRIQEDKVKKSIIQDKISEISSPAFYSQDISGRSQNTGIGAEQKLFQSERLPSIPDFPLSPEQQDFSQQAQFYGQEQSVPAEVQSLIDEHEQRKFYDGRQEPTGQLQYFGDQQAEHEQRKIFGSRQSGAQQYHNEANEQPAIFSGMRPRQNQMQFSEIRDPSSHQQQQIYSNIQMGIDDRVISTDKSYQTVSNIQNQIYSDKQLTTTQTKGFQGHVRPSVFDNRAPLAHPHKTAIHSSVFVSGMNNLPLLPAMVYNAGSLPSSHAIAVGKGTAFRGSVRHHLQTPYVRYVYSHLL